MIKNIFNEMLHNENITKPEILHTIEIISEILQAEEVELEKIEKYYTYGIKREKEFYTDVATRYDSENFVNILRDFDNIPRTVNKLIPIHRRRASNNILKLLTREYFRGYHIELKIDKINLEMALELYITDETQVDRETVFSIFEKVKSRLLIAGMKKVLKIVFRIIEVIHPPEEHWTFIMENSLGKLQPPFIDLFNKFEIETLYFNGGQKWIKLGKSRIKLDNHKFFKPNTLERGTLALFDEIYHLGGEVEKHPLYVRKPYDKVNFENQVSYTIEKPDENITSKTMTNFKIKNPKFKEVARDIGALTFGNLRKTPAPIDSWTIWIPGTYRIGIGVMGNERFILGRTRLSTSYVPKIV